MEKIHWVIRTNCRIFKMAYVLQKRYYEKNEKILKFILCTLFICLAIDDKNLETLKDMFSPFYFLVYFFMYIVVFYFLTIIRLVKIDIFK